MKFFLYLNDVDEDGGPFCIVKGSFKNKFEGWNNSDENVLDRSQYLNKYDFDGDGKAIGRDDRYTSKV